MVQKVVVYRCWNIPNHDFYSEKEAKLAEIQQDIHLLAAGAKSSSYVFRTDGVRKLLDEYDRIQKEE